MSYEAYKDYGPTQDLFLYTLYVVVAVIALVIVSFQGDSDQPFVAGGGGHEQRLYPENLVLVRGEITAFNPFFEEMREFDGPLRQEGIDVTISYLDRYGEERSIAETWMLPCVDHFKLGDTVPVIWSQRRLTGRANMASVVLSKQRLEESLALSEVRKKPPKDPDLKQEAESEIVAMLKQHDKMFRLLDLYVVDFEDESTTWDFAEHYAVWKKQQAKVFATRRDAFGDVTSPRRKQRGGTQTLPVSAEVDFESDESVR